MWQASVLQPATCAALCEPAGQAGPHYVPLAGLMSVGIPTTGMISRRTPACHQPASHLANEEGMPHGSRVLRHLLLLVGLQVPHLHAVVAPACAQQLVPQGRHISVQRRSHRPQPVSNRDLSTTAPRLLALARPAGPRRTCKHHAAVCAPGAAQHRLVSGDGRLGDGLPIALHIPAQHLHCWEREEGSMVCWTCS